MCFIRSLILVLLTSFFLHFCSIEHQRLKNLNEANDSLAGVHRYLTIKNDTIFKFILWKAQNIKTEYPSELWFAKAQQFEYLTTEILTYIQSCVSNLEFNSKSNNADSLLKKLRIYQMEILRIDPEVTNAVNKLAKEITEYFDSIQKIQGETFEPYFSRKSKQEQLLMLNQTLINIQTVETEILQICAWRIR